MKYKSTTTDIVAARKGRLYWGNRYEAKAVSDVLLMADFAEENC
jgi:hypothetical protein